MDEKYTCFCGECFQPVSKATYFRHRPKAEARLARSAPARDAAAPQSPARTLNLAADDDSVRSEMLNIDLDQFELQIEEDALQENTSTDEEDEAKKRRLVRVHVDEPISETIPEAASVAEMSLALVELQRKFKISTAAMTRFAELINIATGPQSVSPSFGNARSLQEEGDLDFRVVDVCVNDDVVFEDAPIECDPDGKRQHANRHKCPICKESRYVLVGPEKGKPRKQIIVFSLKDTIKMLFAQPGFSAKLNGRHGQPHPLSEDADYEMKVGRPFR
jgi:hypothetical protein